MEQFMNHFKMLNNSDVIDITLYHTGRGAEYFTEENQKKILKQIKYFLDAGVPFVKGDLFMTYDGGFWKITDRVFTEHNTSFGINITVTLDEI